MNAIYILIIVLSVLLLCSLFCTDHFKSINSLNIKYNTKKARIPFQLKKPSPKELSLKEKITSELKSQPLTWHDGPGKLFSNSPGQIYSSSKYPWVGPLRLCEDDSDCPSLSSTCTNMNDNFGMCTIAQPNTTVFDIEY